MRLISGLNLLNFQDAKQEYESSFTSVFWGQDASQTRIVPSSCAKYGKIAIYLLSPFRNQNSNDHFICIYACIFVDLECIQGDEDMVE